MFLPRMNGVNYPREHANKQKKKHKSWDFKHSLRDEPDSGVDESDIDWHTTGANVTMSDICGSCDDSLDEDFSEKCDCEESESSSEEAATVSKKKKVVANVRQHSVKKSAATTLFVGTYKSPTKMVRHDQHSSFSILSHHLPIDFFNHQTKPD